MDYLLYVLVAAVMFGVVLIIVRLQKISLSGTGSNGELDQQIITQLKDENQRLGKQLEENRQTVSHLNLELGKSGGRIEQLEKQLAERNEQLHSLDNLNKELERQLSAKNAELQVVTERLSVQKKEIEEIQNSFKQEFKLVADTILKENTNEFSAIHQQKLNDILEPLKTKIAAFEQSIAQKYETELRDKESLRTELKSLVELNQRLSQEAQNLTNALKTDNKQQGNWGEVILEKVLELSGLEKGREYETQTTTKNSDDQTIRPDVVVNLPEQKHLIIDAKVSLVHYLQFANAKTEEERKEGLKKHIDSVKTHIKQLSEKKYETAEKLNPPDFTMLFMPIEGAFSAAIQNDSELFAFAWDKRIVMVSPSTLLATLKTVASIWKQEKTNTNARLIQEESSKMLDKFIGFINDLEDIKKGIDRSQSAFDNAINKLQTGKGNLIGRAEKLKQLGVSHKGQKSMPAFINEENALQSLNNYEQAAED